MTVAIAIWNLNFKVMRFESVKRIIRNTYHVKYRLAVELFEYCALASTGRKSRAEMIRPPSPNMTAPGPKPRLNKGQSISALPRASDVHLFSYREGVVNLNSEVSD